MSRRKKVKSWFYNKGRLQILALVLSVVAWFLVQSSQTVKQKQEFSIRYENLASDLAFRTPPPAVLGVGLTGSFHRLRSLDEEDLTYVVNLQNLSKGSHSIDVDLGSLRLPIDVEASNPSPRRINFVLEPVLTKEIPVELNFMGEPPEGLVIANTEISPNPIQIRGPKSVVEPINSYQVPVSFDGRSESFDSSVLIEFDSEQVESVNSILIEVELAQPNLVKTFESIPVRSLQEGRRLKIEPAQAKVVLRGSTSSLPEEASELELYVSVESLKKGRYRIRGQLELPEGTELVSMQPESFIVNVLEDPEEKPQSND